MPKRSHGFNGSISSLLPELDERRRRQWAAAEARDWAGVVCRSWPAPPGCLARRSRPGCGNWISRSRNVRREAARVRRPGGGRRPVTETDPGLLAALESLVEPVTRGDPESPLRWTCKSTRRLAEELTRQGHPVGPRTVAALLHDGRVQPAGQPQDPRRASATRTATPSSSTSTPGRGDSMQRGQPVISVDTKKKELVGDFKNGGREWRPQGEPEEVRVHDFLDKDLGQGDPLRRLRHGRQRGLGQRRHRPRHGAVRGREHPPLVAARWAERAIPNATRAADHRRRRRQQRSPVAAVEGGAAGAWPTRLGLAITVCHFPPGTSKWNKIEHRLFCFITQNWRGRPLVSHEAIVNLIANTTTSTGLIVKAALDTESLRHRDQGQRRGAGRLATARGTSSTAIGTTRSRRDASGNCKGYLLAKLRSWAGRGRQCSETKRTQW